MSDEPGPDWPPRIRSRAANLPGGDVLMRIAEDPDGSVLNDMRATILDGGKPVEAFSRPLIRELGSDGAADRGLRQLAGEIAAFLAETRLGAVRASGSRKISGDPLFTSGTPYKLPGQMKGSAAADPLATELLVRHLSDDALDAIERMIAAEQKRRRDSLSSATTP